MTGLSIQYCLRRRQAEVALINEAQSANVGLITVVVVVVDTVEVDVILKREFLIEKITTYIFLHWIKTLGIP